jgi:penicillin-binding protein 1A
MAWFQKCKEPKENDRRIGGRRHEDVGTPPSRFAKFRQNIVVRFCAATFSAFGWGFLWLGLTLLVLFAVVIPMYFVAPVILEEGTLVASRMLSDAIYAVDVKTGWFSTEMPKVFAVGPREYFLSLPTSLSWKLGGITAVATIVFVAGAYIRHLRRFASIIAPAVFGGLLVMYYASLDEIKEPPSYGVQLRDFRLKAASHVIDATGKVEIGCFADENRTPVQLSEVSPNLINAILASEDHAFSEHSGFNMYAMVRAGLANMIKAKVASGASTLTMQLTKNVFLTPERTYTRKMREVVIASHLEHSASKDRILYLYVNLVYFGGAYGVEEASRSYFGKSAKDVDVAEAAFLAALINQPEAYRLGGELGKKRVMERRLRVIRLMADRAMITAEVSENAQREEILPRAYAGTCKRIHEYINAAINREYGINGKLAIASAGQTFQTTIELEKQRKLEEACEATLSEYLKRHPENSDTIQCSSVAVRWKTGEVVAMVGGQDFHRNQYDNAMQSARQAGSSFKPFAYVPILEKLYNEEVQSRKDRCAVASLEDCASIMAEPMNLREKCKVLDAPVLVPNVVGWKGRIVNRHAIDNYPYEGRPRHRGMISCELALGESRNTATIWGMGQLASGDMGELNRWNEGERIVRDMAHRLGIQSPLQHRNVTGNTDIERATLLPNYTIGIGSAEVTLWEMTSAFLPMINGGCRRDVSFVKRITDAEGKVIHEYSTAPACNRVLAPQVAYEMRELLRAPVDVTEVTMTKKGEKKVGRLLGTAASLRTTFPVGVLCGKTGTSTGSDGTSSTENWFVGCTTEYLVATRINNINKTPLGHKETGGKNALPVFRKFVQDLKLLDPDAEFPAIDTSVIWQPKVVLDPSIPAPAPTR